MDLSELGGELICQKDAFLCAAKGVTIGIAFQKKIGVGLFGGEGFIMQRLEGDGLSFLHAGGTVRTLTLQPGETLRVDTGCLVALQPSVTYDIQFVGGVKDGAVRWRGAVLRPPHRPGGRVWLQSLPLSRLADRIYKAAPQTGGRRKGEGVDPRPRVRAWQPHRRHVRARSRSTSHCWPPIHLVQVGARPCLPGVEYCRYASSARLALAGRGMRTTPTKMGLSGFPNDICLMQ